MGREGPGGPDGPGGPGGPDGPGGIRCGGAIPLSCRPVVLSSCRPWPFAEGRVAPGARPVDAIDNVDEVGLPPPPSPASSGYSGRPDFVDCGAVSIASMGCAFGCCGHREWEMDRALPQSPLRATAPSRRGPFQVALAGDSPLSEGAFPRSGAGGRAACAMIFNECGKAKRPAAGAARRFVVSSPRRRVCRRRGRVVLAIPTAEPRCQDRRPLLGT